MASNGEGTYLSIEELKQEYDEDSNKGYILKGDVCYVYKGTIQGTKLFFCSCPKNEDW